MSDLRDQANQLEQKVTYALDHQKDAAATKAVYEAIGELAKDPARLSGVAHLMAYDSHAKTFPILQNTMTPEVDIITGANNEVVALEFLGVSKFIPDGRKIEWTK